MFSEFSRGYYLGRLYVEPYAGDHPAMHRTQHERVNEQVYATGEGVERTDAPLVMKLDDCHFPVQGAGDVPADTLALPGSVIGAVGVEGPPDLRGVLLAKAGRARQLLEWFTAYEVDDDRAR
jgi:hypothetical protein